jgi:hypothetical protein
MRGSYSGNTSAFQADAESSILLPRSKYCRVKATRVKVPGPILFQISSAVEQLTVNQLVPGSIPGSGAKNLRRYYV